MRRLALAAVSLTFLAACQPATTELTDEQKGALADSVTVLQTEMLQLWEAADLEGVMRYFVNSPDVGWAWTGAMHYGYDNLVASFRPILDGVTSAEFTVADRRVDVLAEDVVCVRDVGTYSLTYTTGVTRPPLALAMTTIWVRRGSEWKIIHGHESFSAPESG